MSLVCFFNPTICLLTVVSAFFRVKFKLGFFILSHLKQDLSNLNWNSFVSAQCASHFNILVARTMLHSWKLLADFHYYYYCKTGAPNTFYTLKLFFFRFEMKRSTHVYSFFEFCSLAWLLHWFRLSFLNGIKFDQNSLFVRKKMCVVFCKSWSFVVEDRFYATFFPYFYATCFFFMFYTTCKEVYSFDERVKFRITVYFHWKCWLK